MEQHQSQASLQKEPYPTYDNSAMFYGLPQYHHHHPSNYYVPYVAFQAQPPSQLPSSSSHGVSSDRDENIPGVVLPSPHLPNIFIQGNYTGHHPLPPPGSIWYMTNKTIEDLMVHSKHWFSRGRCKEPSENKNMFWNQPCTN
ncbi:hypothetical protein Bca4012_064771 [Brassica carinata]